MADVKIDGYTFFFDGRKHSRKEVRGFLKKGNLVPGLGSLKKIADEHPKGEKLEGFKVSTPGPGGPRIEIGVKGTGKKRKKK